MAKTDFSRSERAVSPVIGVILMVAITVILAAVIGAFVLGLGDGLGGDDVQASLSFEGDADGVTVSHNGGDSLEEAELRGSAMSGDVTITLSSGESEEIDGTALSEGQLNVVVGDTIVGSYDVPAASV